MKYKLHSQAFSLLAIVFLLICVFFIIKIYFFAVLGVAFFLFTAYFFRQPVFSIEPNFNEIRSPAWGKITSIEETIEDDGEKSIHISIFLSVFDVHLQCTPVNATIKNVQYIKGSFINAMNAKSNQCNERNVVNFTTPDFDIEVTQIAGLIARRILCFKNIGAVLNTGEYYGLIRFGSRVDLKIPANIKLHVKKGDKVNGALTVLGTIEKN